VVVLDGVAAGAGWWGRRRDLADMGMFDGHRLAQGSWLEADGLSSTPGAGIASPSGKQWNAGCSPIICTVADRDRLDLDRDFPLSRNGLIDRVNFRTDN